jgi:hypothetical protein
MAQYLFQIGDSGSDEMVICYKPETILSLADTIRAARNMGLADPMPDELQTSLYGVLESRRDRSGGPEGG